jgi:hypothetical protein
MTEKRGNLVYSIVKCRYSGMTQKQTKVLLKINRKNDSGSGDLEKMERTDF